MKEDDIALEPGPRKRTLIENASGPAGAVEIPERDYGSLGGVFEEQRRGQVRVDVQGRECRCRGRHRDMYL